MGLAGKGSRVRAEAIVPICRRKNAKLVGRVLLVCNCGEQPRSVFLTDSLREECNGSDENGALEVSKTKATVRRWLRGSCGARLTRWQTDRHPTRRENRPETTVRPGCGSRRGISHISTQGGGLVRGVVTEIPSPHSWAFHTLLSLLVLELSMEPPHRSTVAIFARSLSCLRMVVIAPTLN